jgi:hypothetical protein
MFTGDRKKEYQRDYMRRVRSNKKGLTKNLGLTEDNVRPEIKTQPAPPAPLHKDKDPNYVFINGSYFKKTAT